MIFNVWLFSVQTKKVSIWLLQGSSAANELCSFTCCEGELASVRDVDMQADIQLNIPRLIVCVHIEHHHISEMHVEA